jgi:predicted TIM-barrel fold metal-dependent hydrolase
LIDGTLVVDVHQHLARVGSLKMPWDEWAPPKVTGVPFDELYRDDGTIDPGAYLAYLDDEGIDVALLMSEYSPRVTGIQAIEHMLPIAEADPSRVGVIGAVNPHLHFPAVDELRRQLDLGAVALKLHAVHGDYSPARADLYPVYALCQERGIAVVFHCGTSNFAGASNTLADPALLANVVRDFPNLSIVLAHGGRGWSYAAAAWFALTYEHVWIELSGLPPKRLPQYYATVGFERLAPKCIFGTDFPAIPGLRRNADAILGLGLDLDLLERIMWRNAAQVYGLDRVPAIASRLALSG